MNHQRTSAQFESFVFFFFYWMSHINKTHDNFLRAILADKQIAIDYFKASLPESVQQKLDFTTLTQQPDSYVSDDLKTSISDIVYSCMRKDGRKSVKVSLLIEHKSYVSKYVTIQIGSYIFSGMLKQIGNKEEPSLIIPVLLYHGRKRWEYKTLGDLVEDLEPALREYLPDFEYIYHNLGEMDDDQIRQLNNKFLAASFLAMKYSQFQTDLENLIPELLSMTREASENLQSSLIVYIFVKSGLEEQRIVAILQTLPTTIKEKTMNTLEIFIEKGKKMGREEGRAEGLEEGMNKGKSEKTQEVVRNLIRVSALSDEQIADIAEVSLAYVAQIRKDM